MPRTTRLMGTRYPIEDALIDGTIHVTHKDAVKGIRGDPANCALALASNRSMGSDMALFFKTRALLLIDGKVWRFGLPAGTAQWIKDFDDEKVTVPKGIKVDLTLRRPSPRDRLGQTHAPTGKNGKRATVPPGARKPISTVGGTTGIPRGGYSGPGVYKTVLSK